MIIYILCCIIIIPMTKQRQIILYSRIVENLTSFFGFKISVIFNIFYAIPNWFNLILQLTNIYRHNDIINSGVLKIGFPINREHISNTLAIGLRKLPRTRQNQSNKTTCKPRIYTITLANFVYVWPVNLPLDSIPLGVTSRGRINIIFRNRP